MGSPAKRGKEFVLPTDLVVRESTGPVQVIRAETKR
jgi:hypothetical protein